MRFKAEIEISTREGILNPEEKAISNTLKNMGLNLNSLSLNKKFYIDFESENMQSARKDIKSLTTDLLANTIVQDYEVHIEEIK